RKTSTTTVRGRARSVMPSPGRRASTPDGRTWTNTTISRRSHEAGGGGGRGGIMAQSRGRSAPREEALHGFQFVRERVLPEPVRVQPEAVDHLTVVNALARGDFAVLGPSVEAEQRHLAVVLVDDPVFRDLESLVLPALLVVVAFDALRRHDLDRHVRR